jgi:hypothetical protein
MNHLYTTLRNEPGKAISSYNKALGTDLIFGAAVTAPKPTVATAA